MIVIVAGSKRFETPLGLLENSAQLAALVLLLGEQDLEGADLALLLGKGLVPAITL
jgi:hypothetical protein